MKAEYVVIVCGGDQKDNGVELYFTQHADDVTLEACKDVSLNDSWFNYIYSVHFIRLNDWEETSKSVESQIEIIKERQLEDEAKERREYERLKAKFGKKQP